jgi:diaminopimelate epimerase
MGDNPYMIWNFTKMHGAGNDFVVLDGVRQPIDMTPERARALAHRQFGIGCDQFIILEPALNADVFMRIYNPDGSESGACGNATRCVADIICHEKKLNEISIETISGILNCKRIDQTIIVNMGAPKAIEHSVNVQNFIGTKIDMGNPHFVTIIDDVSKIDLADVGSKLEIDTMFPQKSNIEFVQILSPQTVRMRVWERGAGITLACGSGACAVGVAVISQGLCTSPVTIAMDGGELQIIYNPDIDKSVYMKGGSTYVFDGVFQLV